MKKVSKKKDKMSKSPELVLQAKIQGFAKALDSHEKYRGNYDMPYKLQLIIQYMAETVVRKMMHEDIEYNADVKQCEFLKEVFDETFQENLPEEQREEIWGITFNTINNMIKYLFEFYEESDK